MLPLRFATSWRTASVVLIVLVLVGMLMPADWFVSEKQKLADWAGSIDKWLHGVTFLLLAIWFTGLYGRNSYWRIALGLLAFGALIEIAQNLVDYRTAEWADMVANVAGIGAGLAIALVGLGGWGLWIERRLMPAEVDSGGD